MVYTVLSINVTCMKSDVTQYFLLPENKYTEYTALKYETTRFTLKVNFSEFSF